MDKANDNYEQEIEKLLLERFGFSEDDGDGEGIDCNAQLKIFSFMDEYKKIHAGVMKEKDEEIEHLRFRFGEEMELTQSLVKDKERLRNLIYELKMLIPDSADGIVLLRQCNKALLETKTKISNPKD